MFNFFRKERKSTIQKKGLNLKDFENQKLTNLQKDLINFMKKIDLKLNDAFKSPQDKAQQFNSLIKYLFEKIGYSVTITDGLQDDGIDIHCRNENNKLEVVIQCKAYSAIHNNQLISKQNVREFLGAASKEKTKYACFITTSYFNEYAYEEDQSQLDSDENTQLILIDRDKLFFILLKYCPEIMNPVFQDTYNKKSGMKQCPECKTYTLVKLFGRKYKNHYFECTECRETFNVNKIEG